MNRINDYYSILGVSRNATDEEIKRAFKRLAKAYHPDVNHAPDAHERFIEIGEAYEVLKDSSARASYDRFFEEARSQSNGGYNQQRANQQQQKQYHQQKQTDEYAHYQHTQERAKAQAEKYAEMSLDAIFKILDFAIETGRTILVGERDKPNVNLFDYIKMGFFGVLFTICIIISFTGVGTIPGIAFGYLIITSQTKKGHFLGIVPFIISTLVADLIVVILLLNMIANM